MPLLTQTNFDAVTEVLSRQVDKFGRPEPRGWTVWCFQNRKAWGDQESPRYQCTRGFGIPVLWRPNPSRLSRVEVLGPDFQALRQQCEQAWGEGCDLVLARGHAHEAKADPDFARLSNQGANS